MTAAALVTALLVTLATLGATWFMRRGTRRLSPIAYLKDATVSRQWLMEHQADD